MKEKYGLTPNWQKVEQGKHPALGDAEIHLWWLPLTLNSNQQKSALALLSNIQRDKYERRQPDKRKQSYLAGRYYLLNLLGQYTNSPAKEISLSYTRLDKPYLSDKQNNIEFNFTDTTINNAPSNDDLEDNQSNDEDAYGLFSFCKHHSIGVDIESLNRKANFRGISESRFSQSEQKFVTNKNGTINDQRCLAIWTRKEAFGKAIGKGINYTMNALDLSSPNNFELNFSSHDSDWRLTQIQLTKNVISCVAHQGHQALDIKIFNSINHIP